MYYIYKSTCIYIYIYIYSIVLVHHVFWPAKSWRTVGE